MRKVIPLAIAGGVLVASGGVFGAAQALAKDIELSQDGVPMKVRTWDGTVGDVLDDQGITLGEHDLVAPGVDDALTDGQRISVRYGRELRLTIDGQSETLWTTALTLDEALAERSIRDESRMSTSRNA
ncbi:MAG: ubiquitin-like domain-containing protein, partial [Propionibacteriaceae bacterium]|nr:ubiquitin-like domain-containing protein [Propionibacteriaceae bacterium]